MASSAWVCHSICLVPGLPTPSKVARCGCPFSLTDSYTQRAWSQTATVHAALSSGPEGQIIRLLKKKKKKAQEEEDF